MKKRILSILLCIAVIICMMPATALAANGTGHQISVKIYKVVLDSSKPLGYQNPELVTTKVVTCTDGTGHSGYNHFVYLKEFHPKNVGLNTTDWNGYVFEATFNKNNIQPTFYDWKNDKVNATANVTGSEPYPCSKNFYLVYKEAKPVDPKPVKAVVSATKTLDGEVPEEGAFQFVLKDANDIVVARAQNNGNGIVDFNLPEFKEEGTFEYTMSEVNGQNNDINYDESVYEVKVTVTKEGNTLKATVSYANEDGTLDGIPAFANTTKQTPPPVEEPTPATALVSATKTLDGEVPEDGAFQFVLKDANDIVVARAQNNGNGIVDFNLPEFKEEGTFEYTMSEVNGQNNDINYDESVYKVKVTVTEEDNTLKAAVSYFDKDGNPINSTTPEFANTTKPDLENPTDEQVKEALKDVQIDVSCINKDADHSNKYFKLVEIPDGYTVATPELQDGVYVAKVTVSAEAAKNAYNKAEESKGKTHVLAEGVADEFLYLQYKDGNWYLRVDDPDKQILFNVICETDGVEEFTVRYTDGVDGQEIFADQVTNNLKYGDATPAFSGGTPTREGYTFTGWTPSVAEKVTGNATYTATWSKNETGGGGGTVTYYTVKWNNYDNTTLETDYCTYGQMPKYDGATPVKPADDKYTYEFIGWDKEVVKVTGNAVYTAQFKAVAKEPADPENPTDPADPTKPEKPQKPATPEASGNTDAEKSEVPKTADANDLMLWAALLLAAGTGLAGTALRKRKADSGK